MDDSRLRELASKRLAALRDLDKSNDDLASEIIRYSVAHPGVTRVQLAKLSGLSRQTVWKILSGN